MKIPSENYKIFETSASPGEDYATQGLIMPSQYINYPIMAHLIEDQNNGNYYTLAQDNVVIQIGSQVQYLEFDIVDCLGNTMPIYSTNIGVGTLNINLKVTYPERTEVMANTTQTYAQSVVGNIKPMNTF
jgi:hypothetical protein